MLSDSPQQYMCQQENDGRFDRMRNGILIINQPLLGIDPYNATNCFPFGDHSTAARGPFLSENHNPAMLMGQHIKWGAA